MYCGTNVPEAGEDDGDDDYFNNPLKHILPKLTNTKKDRGRAKHMDGTGKGRRKRGKPRAQPQSLSAACDLGNSLSPPEEKKNKSLWKVEQEISELEEFSKKLNIFASSSAVSERRKEMMDESGSESVVFVVDTDTEKSFTEELYVVEPHCSIEICDLECCSTEIVRWKMSEPFNDIAKKYASQWSCPLESVLLSKKCGKEITVKDTPFTVSFSEKDVNYLTVRKSSDCDSVDLSQITIKWLLAERNKPIVSAISKDVPFKILKRNFATYNGLDEEKLTLVFDGELIGPEETAETLEIEEGDCVDVHIKSYHCGD